MTNGAIDRIGHGSVHVPNTCISLFGGIQPARLRTYSLRCFTGWAIERLTYSTLSTLDLADVPPSWEYTDRIPNLGAMRLVTYVYRRVAALDNQNPLMLKFDESAQLLFQAFQTELEQRIRGSDISPAMQAHLSKYRSLLPSLALLFALADGHTQTVPIVYACDWCEYLETHAHARTLNRIYP